MSREKLVGKAVPRKEDERMIRGQATYIDDIVLADLHHVAILRSPFAHARIGAIDARAALARAGVIDVITGADTRDVGSVPRSTVLPEAVHSPRTPVLAEGVARFVGEPIAAVVATSKEAARDALEFIEVDYDPLPVASDPVQALAPGAPQLHESVPGNLAFEHVTSGGSLTWDEARAQADHVLEQPLVHQRLIPMAMEPRGVVASWDRGEGELTLRTSTQIPHFVRTFVALMLGLAETHLRVIAPDVGGGFGSKLNVYREEALLGFIARRTGKSVKWIEGRGENFQATIHGRGQTGVLRVACKHDGAVLGLEYEVVADLGAYHQLLTPAMPAITGLMLSGAYAIPHISIHVRGAFTNRMSTDAYRGAGRPEATMVIERAIDLVAHELGLDPVDVRRTNFPTAFPFTTATGLTYDSGDYTLALDRALELADYAGLRAQQTAGRSLERIIGVGISSYVEICALGPSAAMPSGGFGWESATVRAHPTGSVTVMTGASPHGQGQETSFAQIAADMLGIGLDDVRIVHGDTAVVPYGVGTFGSRATAVGGTAMVRALEKLIAEATRFASALLDCEPAQVTFEEGVFKGPGGEVAWGAVTFAAHTAVKLPGQTEPGLQATAVYEPENFCYPFCTHICLVEIDRETGALEILRYVAVDDCGNVINPMLVDGQIHGGIAQGLGQAMLEQATYDEDGNLVTGSLMDYAIPRAHDLPRFECDRTVTPSPVNPLGVKGVGEAGTIGSTPALVNAVVDALSPFGVRHVDMPLTPHRIWSALESARVLQGGPA
jgi:carbon-monoxide dehydrogenase large subunit